MAVILYHRAGVLPAGRLRARLADALPMRRWICGEEDDGARDRVVPLRGHQLICGRGDGAPLFVELRFVDAPLPGSSTAGSSTAGAPPHASHLTISPPTTEDTREADLVTALIVDTLIGEEAAGAWCQLSPDGEWLAAAGVGEVLRRVKAGENLATIARECVALNARPAQGAPASAFRAELPQLARLPTLALLLNRGDAPAFDWALLGQGLRALDPEGDWQVERSDRHGRETAACLNGRGARITVAHTPIAMPDDMLQVGLGRSFWLTQPDEIQALRRHGASLAIMCDMDTTMAGPTPTRQVAKAMALALVMLALDYQKAGQLAGLANMAHATVFAPSHLSMLGGPLHGDEVPIQMFVATAFHNTTAGAISLSTAGMMPFVGREVEIWNAPGDLDHVGARLNGVLRYLMAQGPVLRHGDTVGGEEETPLRVLHTISRAERPYAGGATIPALTLEFGTARPYPRRLGQAMSPSMPLPMAAPLRRPGGFGRKGL